MKWKYKFRRISTLGNYFSEHCEQVQELGQEGWELAGVLPEVNNWFWLIFKRPETTEES